MFYWAPCHCLALRIIRTPLAIDIRAQSTLKGWQSAFALQPPILLTEKAHDFRDCPKQAILSHGIDGAKTETL